MIIHPLAAQDIADIWEYIAQDNAGAAKKVREELQKAIHSLRTFPHQGHKRPDLTAGPYRFLIVREYLIAYAPEERPLLVIAVIHGRRNPRAISAILKWRQ